MQRSRFWVVHHIHFQQDNNRFSQTPFISWISLAQIGMVTTTWCWHANAKAQSSQKRNQAIESVYCVTAFEERGEIQILITRFQRQSPLLLPLWPVLIYRLCDMSFGLAKFESLGTSLKILDTDRRLMRTDRSQ